MFAKVVAFFENHSYTQVKKPMEVNEMDNKKLNEQELEQISGGVIPVLLMQDKEVDEQMLTLGGITAHCTHCGFEFPVPSSRQGRQVECQSCHEMFTVK